MARRDLAVESRKSLYEYELEATSTPMLKSTLVVVCGRRALAWSFAVYENEIG